MMSHPTRGPSLVVVCCDRSMARRRILYRHCSRDIQELSCRKENAERGRMRRGRVIRHLAEAWTDLVWMQKCLPARILASWEPPDLPLHPLTFPLPVDILCRMVNPLALIILVCERHNAWSSASEEWLVILSQRCSFLEERFVNLFAPNHASWLLRKSLVSSHDGKGREIKSLSSLQAEDRFWTTCPRGGMIWTTASAMPGRGRWMQLLKTWL